MSQDSALEQPDGTLIAIEGFVTLPFCLPRKQLSFEAVYVKNIGYDCILGRDILGTSGMIVHFGKGTFGWSNSQTQALRFDKKLNDIGKIYALSPVSLGISRPPTTIDHEGIADALSRASLKADEKVVLEQLVTNYESIFSKQPGKTTRVEHYIDVENHHPIASAPYRYSPAKRAHIDSLIQDMLDQGVIEPSEGPWSSPIIVVAKKDGGSRLCVDYRKINQVTRRDVYPLPRINDILESIRKPNYITTLDMTSGYYQIPLHEAHRDIAALITHRGLFRPKVLMFGLSNAPSSFQRMVNNLFGDLSDQGVCAYLDDLIIASRDFEIHVKTLAEVFNRLSQAGLTIKASKTNFCQKECRILGHIVNNLGIKVDPEKTFLMSTYPTPRNVKQLRRFLGMASYYRRFIENFSKIADPLNLLLHKEVEFKWQEAQELAFDKLKTCLSSAPILSAPDYEHPFIIHTDASSTGLGACLSQRINQKRHVVQFASCSLSAAERNYSTTERECLGVKWAIEKFRPYIEGTKFEVYTDHSAIKWLHRAPDPTGKFARWNSALQAFDFTIHHIPGKNNVIADALSRLNEEESLVGHSAVVQCDKPLVGNISAVKKMEPLLVRFDREEIVKAQREDQKIGALIAYLEDNTVSPEKEIQEWVEKKASLSDIRESVLYQDIGKCENGWDSFRILIPSSLKARVLYLNHDIPTAGHFGAKKTLKRIKSQFTWSGLTLDVLKYVKSCDKCQAHKVPSVKPAGLMKPNEVSEPWDVISIDLKGPLPRSKRGFKFILVVTCYLTKWVEIFPLRNATTKPIVNHLVDDVFTRYGLPSCVVSDNGSQFVSKLFKAVFERLQVKLRYTSLYSPQSNGLVERYNRTIGTLIATFIEGNEQRDWDRYLQQFAMALRTVPQETTGLTPAFLMFGREMRTATSLLSEKDPDHYLDPELEKVYGLKIVPKVAKALELARANIKKAQCRQKTYYDKHHRNFEFNLGDTVSRKTFYQSKAIDDYSAKLDKKYDGPYRIAEKLSPHTYKLETPDGKSLKGTYQVSNLKPYVERTELKILGDDLGTFSDQEDKSDDEESQIPVKATGRVLRPRDPKTGKVQAQVANIRR